MGFSLIRINGAIPIRDEEDVIDLYGYKQLTGVTTTKKVLVIKNINDVNCHNNHYFSIKFNNIINSLFLICGNQKIFNLRLEAFGTDDVYVKNLFISENTIDNFKFGRKGVITCHVKTLIHITKCLNIENLDKKCIGKLVTIYPISRKLVSQIFNKELLGVL